MDVVRTYLSAQLMLNVFLAALLWSFYLRLHKQEFFWWWAWAWTAFAGFLGFGFVALKLAPEWTLFKGSLVLASVICGFIQAPLLVFGAWTLRAPGPPARYWLRVGIGLALAAGVLSFALAFHWREQPLTSFALGTAPRTLALAAALYFCAWIFFGRWRRMRSWAAGITGWFCLLYATDETFDTVVYSNRSLFDLGFAASQFFGLPLVPSSPFFFLDLVYGCGICFGMVVMLVEEHRRTEHALLECNDRSQAMAASNAALQAEIRERERVEAELRESESRYRDLVEHSKESISTHDLEGRMLSANPALARMLGYEVAELLQIPMRENVPPEFRDQFDEYLAKLRKDGVADGIAILKTRTGEHRISEYHCVVRTEGGSAPIVHKIGYDVTERMQAEEALRRSEEQLRHAQKMEVIGRIAGGVAHDFNNLLCGINLYLGLALEQVKPADRVLLDNLDRALDAARSAGSLTRQLLTISRRQVAERQVVNINDIVITASDLLGRLLSENIYTSMRLGQGSGKASVDPLQMQQVVMNLVLNARHAMPEGGQLTIRTVNVDLDAPPVGEYFISPPEPGPYVVLEVSDTGHGMSDEILAHLFEPFFTTKELGQGTGLGLATAYGIVTHSGGHISVQTTLGHGTTFKVYLPRVDDRLIESPPEIAPARETPAPSGARTVLVVDDTEVVRDAVSKDLRRHGYTVLTASNAAEAIRIAEEYRATIDLLLTDVALPGMNGWDLAQHFATKRPSSKILYMSGHDQAMFAANVAELNSNILLYKPFTSRDLLAAVSTAVGEPVAHQAESERQGGSREDPPQQ